MEVGRETSVERARRTTRANEQAASIAAPYGKLNDAAVPWPFENPEVPPFPASVETLAAETSRYRSTWFALSACTGRFSMAVAIFERKPKPWARLYARKTLRSQ